jgi:hypothetical protein
MLARDMVSSARSLVSALALFALGCPSDDDGSDTGASTADDHGSEEHGSEEHGSEEHGTAETTADDPVAAYCSCVFNNCHEPYHEKWGENEITSEEACHAEAEALPVNGSDIEMGNFIECRMHFCELAADDESVCPNALGDAVCM